MNTGTNIIRQRFVLFRWISGFCTCLLYLSNSNCPAIGLVRRNRNVYNLLLLLLLLRVWTRNDSGGNSLLNQRHLWSGNDGRVVGIFYFVLLLMHQSRTSLENNSLCAVLEFPVGASAFVRLAWHFVETLVECEVVSDRVLPVTCVHSKNIQLIINQNYAQVFLSALHAFKTVISVAFFSYFTNSFICHYITALSTL